MKKFLIFVTLCTIFNCTVGIADARGGHGGGRGGFHGRMHGGRGGMYESRRGGARGGYRGMPYGERRMYGYGMDASPNWGTWGGWARPHHRFRSYGWGAWDDPYYASAGGYGCNNYNGGTVDAAGSLYPTYTYSYIPATITGSTWSSGTVSAVPIKSIEPDDTKEKITFKSKFKLGPDADIIEGGKIAFRLLDDAFLLVNEKNVVVVDQKTGTQAISLYPDEVLIWHLGQELEKQTLGLKSALKAKTALLDSSSVKNSTEKNKALNTELENLDKTIYLLETARKNLGTIKEQIPDEDVAPAKGAMEIFASTWMLPDGNLLCARLDDGTYVYLDGKGSYKDSKRTPLKKAYPGKYEVIVFEYLKKLVAESTKTTSNLKDDIDNTQWAIEKLKEELEEEYTDKHADTANNTIDESKRSINQAIIRSEHKFAAITNQVETMPGEVEAAKKLIAALEK